MEIEEENSLSVFFTGVSNALEIKATDTFLTAISKLILRKFFWENNTSTTRKKVEFFINDIFGIEAVCNETNNPLSVIDGKQLVVSLGMDKKVSLVLGPTYV